MKASCIFLQTETQIKIAHSIMKKPRPTILPLTLVCATLSLFGLVACDKKPPVATLPSAATPRPQDPVAQKPIEAPVPKPTPTPEPSPAPKKTVLIPAKDIINPQEVSNQLKNVKIQGKDLSFTTTGTDPYFSFPFLGSMPNGALVQVDITLPKKQMVQLFYQRMGDSRYSEKNSLIIVRDAGRQIIQWKIDAPLNGRLRLDPGGSPGKYTIHNVEVIY